MYFEQYINPDTGACAYLLADEATGDAAVVHAFGRLQGEMLRVIEERGWRLRYRIDTRLVDETSHYQDRLGGLLSGLGVRVRSAEPHEAGVLAAVPRVGPILHGGSGLNREVCLETPVGEVRLLQSVGAHSRSWVPGEVPSGSYSQVFLPLGRELVQLMACPAGDDEIYLLAGGHLISGRRSQAEDQPLLSPLLADLMEGSEELEVWPRRASGALHSTLGQERSRARQTLGATLERSSWARPTPTQARQAC